MGYIFLHVTLAFVSQLAVAGFSAHMDINRAHEIANEARRIKKQLKDSQQMALLYNNRERIFGTPVTSVSVLFLCSLIGFAYLCK